MLSYNLLTISKISPPLQLFFKYRPFVRVILSEREDLSVLTRAPHNILKKANEVRWLATINNKGIITFSLKLYAIELLCHSHDLQR